MNILSFINIHTVTVSFMDFFIKSVNYYGTVTVTVKITVTVQNDHFVLFWLYGPKRRGNVANDHVESTKEPL